MQSLWVENVMADLLVALHEYRNTFAESLLQGLIIVDIDNLQAKTETLLPRGKRHLHLTA